MLLIYDAQKCFNFRLHQNIIQVLKESTLRLLIALTLLQPAAAAGHSRVVVTYNLHRFCDPDRLNVPKVQE